jgi:hypothetical protein
VRNHGSLILRPLQESRHSSLLVDIGADGNSGDSGSRHFADSSDRGLAMRESHAESDISRIAVAGEDDIPGGADGGCFGGGLVF